jgi:hypothetical protein
VTGGRPRRRARTWPLLLLAFASCGTTSEAELRCAEAAARLETCCPAFDAAASGFTCEAADGEPPVTLAQAACVAALGCAELQSTQVCARAVVFMNGGPWPAGAPQGLCP